MGEAEKLAILNLSIRNGRVTTDVLRIQPKQSILARADKVQVYWQSAPRSKDGYWRVGDGLAYVRKSDNYELPESFRKPPQPIGHVLTWSDYCDGILVFLPRGYSANALDPWPAADAVKGRIALWWSPNFGRAGYLQNRTIQWRLVGLPGRIEDATKAINTQHGPDEDIYPLEAG
jgi:hypothetical protein